MSAMAIQAASAQAASAPNCPVAISAVPILQLTRRGRLVFFGIPALVVAAAALLVAMGIIFGSIAGPAHASAGFTPVSMEKYATTVTVLQGESLWSIARDTNPARNARDVVQEMVVLNDLGAGIVHAGQQLFVPLPK